jgi:hypothetical protein
MYLSLIGKDKINVERFKLNEIQKQSDFKLAGYQFH